MSNLTCLYMFSKLITWYRNCNLCPLPRLRLFLLGFQHSLLSVVICLGWGLLYHVSMLVILSWCNSCLTCHVTETSWMKILTSFIFCLILYFNYTISSFHFLPPDIPIYPFLISFKFMAFLVINSYCTHICIQI